MGSLTEASGVNSTAMGFYTIAPGVNSIAMGYGTMASGENSTAMGYSTIASGNFSTAMGSYGSTNDHTGSFIIHDNINENVYGITQNSKDK